MDVALSYFEGCPHWRLADERLRTALAELGPGVDADPVYLVVNTPEEAHRIGFRGSPTILIDGHDPFPTDAPAGLSCRVYRTEQGTEGAPSLAQLREVLQSRR